MVLQCHGAFRRHAGQLRVVDDGLTVQHHRAAVPYTPLTLPTNRKVEITGVARTFTKKTAMKMDTQLEIVMLYVDTSGYVRSYD